MQDFFEKIFVKRASKITPNLNNMRQAYEFLKEPSARTPCVVVGGTNGKGSTSGFLWHLLAASGLRVGLYSSPHLVNFRERFLISGEEIKDPAIVEQLEFLKTKIPSDLYEALSFFEVATLIAFLLFEKNKTEFNVLEVGMGGRWDSTNILQPLASVIVNVSLDHQAYLGSTLPEIAFEKAGIMRTGKPVFLGAGGGLYDNPDAFEVIATHAQKLNAPILQWQKDFQKNSFSQLPAWFQSRSAEYLENNFVLACAVHAWLRDHHPDIVKNSIPYREFPFANIPLPMTLTGRRQKLHVFPHTLILDVCHNQDGAKNFVQTLQRPTPAFVSILNDKDINEILDILKGILAPIVLFKMDHARSIQGDELASRHKDLRLFASFDSAWQFALENWPQKFAAPWAVCGSVLAVGKVISYFAACPENGFDRDELRGFSPHSF